MLRNTPGGPQLAFQQTEGVRPSTWPDAAVLQMLHLDTVVATREDLQIQLDRALALGATELLDRTDDQDEPLYVFADPAGYVFADRAGHPFLHFRGMTRGSHGRRGPPARRNTSKASFVPPNEFQRARTLIAMPPRAGGSTGYGQRSLPEAERHTRRKATDQWRTPA